jgi:hypothetical protein
MQLETMAETPGGQLPVPSRPPPPVWGPDLVGKRLVQAFVTLDRLPRLPGPREPGGHWPRTITEWADQLAQAELEESERQMRHQISNRVVIRPTAAQIAQMDAAFEWLRELRAIDAGMAIVTTLWALRTARRRSIKALCAEKQWPPHTFFRKKAKALAAIAKMLNSRAVPVS